MDAYEYALDLCKQENVQSLAFPNIIASVMKYNVEESIVDPYLIDSDFDSDFIRSTWVKCMLKAVEYAHQNNLSEAWHYLDLILEDRTIAISYLRKLLNGRKTYLNGTLYDFYTFLKDDLGIEIKNLRTGNIKSFYTSHTYLEMAMGIKISDCRATHKTIHKAKGEEYDNVMVIINDTKDIDVLLNPGLNDNTSHRVYYVGMSRAKKRLFINIENIPIEKVDDFKNIPIDVVRL